MESDTMRKTVYMGKTSPLLDLVLETTVYIQPISEHWSEKQKLS